MIQLKCSSETSGVFQRFMRCYIPGARTLQHIRKVSLNSIFPRTMIPVFAKNMGYHTHADVDGCLTIYLNWIGLLTDSPSFPLASIRTRFSTRGSLCLSPASYWFLAWLIHLLWRLRQYVPPKRRRWKYFSLSPPWKSQKQRGLECLFLCQSLMRNVLCRTSNNSG
jgi:hypothetical protein